jgi:hypothetical protein
MWDLKLVILSFALIGQAAAVEPAHIRVGRVPISGGAELITWFEQLPDGELPILSALKDTFVNSEPTDDRLRQVWVYTFAPPSMGQRIMGTIPFLYHRPAIKGAHPSTAPHPVFDMGAPSRGTWTHMATATVQSQIVNPAGAIARLTTRSYGSNLSEYRKTHIWEALDVISPTHESTGALTSDEFAMLQSRLQLNGRMFSGLVRDEALPRFHEKLQIERTEIRGHNWELLRQSAEDNGLYFQPMALAGTPASFAMLWVARDELDGARLFHAQFLKIANPFNDAALAKWTGYTETQDIDGKPTVMIPLALYSLDYPGVPLLLIDFRRPSAPGRGEMALRFADDLTAGVLGFTGFGNWTYLALKSSWMFVHKRHGAPTNRALRRRAFVALRHALGADDTLDPELRTQLVDRMRRLDLDPLDRSWDQQVRNARIQYEALLKLVSDPAGLPRLVLKDREHEARGLAHGTMARAFLRAASIGTLGAYRHHDELTAAKAEQIAQQRRERVSQHDPLPPPPVPNAETVLAGAGE